MPRYIDRTRVAGRFVNADQATESRRTSAAIQRIVRLHLGDRLLVQRGGCGHCRRAQALADLFGGSHDAQQIFTR